MSRLRILIYSQCPFFGGCENVIVNLRQSDRIAGRYEIVQRFEDNDEYRAGMKKFAMAHGSHGGLAIESPGVRPETGLLDGFRFAWRQLQMERRNYRLLKREITNVKPEILLVNNGGYPAAMSCLTACMAGKSLGLPVALVVNNMAAPKSAMRLDHHLLDWRIARSVDRFVTASKAAGRRLHEMRGFAPEKMRAIPNTPVRGEQESVAASAPVVDVRGKFGIAADDCVFLSAGLLTHRKGYHVLLDALALLKAREVTGVHALVLGEGEEREALEAQAKILGVESSITFAGHQPSIFPFLEHADWFVIPSVENEDFPYVVVEAMAHGQPIIGTRVAGIPEQIEDGVTGSVIEPGDPKALADAMEAAAAGRWDRDQMASASKQRFKQHFSFEQVESAYLELFDELSHSGAVSG